jgi:chemotaxis protein MotB
VTATRSIPLALGLALASAGCVTQGKFDAQVAESERLRKALQDQGKRAQDCEASLGQTEAARTAAAAEAERQRQLAGQLAKTGEQLAAEKAAAAAEAERQRQLASQLSAEKTALEKKSAEYQALSTSLADEIRAGRIQISELQGKMTVRMAEKVLFPSGSATVNRDGKKTLEKIAAAFHELKGRIVRVEGHTDDVPIHTAQFPSNWELSAARAIAVVRLLQAQGVDPNSLGAAGYAEFQPIASNDTPEGRAQNRRIEITLASPPPPVANVR